METMGQSDQVYRDAVAAFQARQPSIAAQKLRQVAQTGGGTGEMLELLAICEAQLGRPAEARKAFEMSTRIAPSRVSGHHNYSLFLMNQGILDLASEENSVTLTIDPNHAAALKVRDEILRRIGELKYTAQEGFQVKKGGVDPLHNGNSAFARLKCPTCGAMCFVTARTCHKCSMLLPELDELPVMEK